MANEQIESSRIQNVFVYKYMHAQTHMYTHAYMHVYCVITITLKSKQNVYTQTVAKCD